MLLVGRESIPLLFLRFSQTSCIIPPERVHDYCLADLQGSRHDKHCDSRDRVAGRSWGASRVWGAQWAMGPYMEAMRTGPVEYVLTSTEAAAGFMATVCGMLTGRPGACYGTYGPGATNLCTGVGTALELPSIIPTLRADRKNKRHFAPAPAARSP